MPDNKEKPKYTWDDWSFFLIILPVLAVMYLIFVVLP